LDSEQLQAKPFFGFPENEKPLNFPSSPLWSGGKPTPQGERMESFIVLEITWAMIFTSYLMLS
jgi:hypothetical protein